MHPIYTYTLVYILLQMHYLIILNVILIDPDPVPRFSTEYSFIGMQRKYSIKE